MRILLIGPEWDTGQWTAYCAGGLRALGHTVLAIQYGRDLSRPVALPGRVRRRLMGHHQYHIRRVLDAARRDNLRVIKAAETRPNLTIVLKGEFLLPETVERLRALTNGPVVQWCGDDPTWFPNIVAAAHLYDRFFLAEPSYGPELARRGVDAEFLPHAAEPNVWSARAHLAPESPEWDVVFVGDARHNMGHLPSSRTRVDLVEAAAALTGLRTAVWGRGWEKLDPSSHARESHQGLTLLPAENVARTYRSAKIALNVHHAQMRDGVNMRTFEIPAAGAFQLCDAKTRLRELFEIEEEIAVYSDADGLAECVHRYVADTAARDRIATAGRARILRDHTYQVRMTQLVSRAF